MGKAISTSGTGEVSVSGPVNLGSGAKLAVTGNSTLRMQLSSGPQATVGQAVQAQVSDNATLELAGAASALSSGANRADIQNNSLAQKGVHVTGTNQQVGGIDGSGTTAVEPGAQLAANHIVQSALVIGGQVGSPGKVTMDASDPFGKPLMVSPLDGLGDQTSSGLILANSLSPSGPLGAGDISSTALIGVAADSANLTIPKTGNSIQIGNSLPVPEPSTLLLALLAVLGVVGARHRRCAS